MSSDSSSGLKISIVGAGIAGLTAALALRRNGHQVQIFEAYQNKKEVGAALSVPVNALRVLDFLQIRRENLKGVPFQNVVTFDAHSGEVISVPRPSTGARNPISLLCHRGDLYEELTNLATGEGQGPPVKLHLGVKVLDCDPENGTISLLNNQIVQADLVLGADGIHSTVRSNILRDVKTPSLSGVTLFRTVFQFHDTPELHWITEGDPGPRVFLAKGEPFRMVLMYLCRDKTLLNFAGFYADSLENEGGFKPTASLEDFRAMYHDFHPKLFHVLDLPLQAELLRWQLSVLPILPTWIRGRSALIGDSAHGTLPFLAQGAAMAIEEGGVIGCLFPSGTKPEDVPERVKAYEELRKTRGEFVRNESIEQLKSLIRNGPVANYEIHGQLLQFDALAAAQECFQQRFL
ncbi:FAD/NAD(P)-binding domain-containing protein [Favolaschia claudopus]|uniref:FAD/NAD(P)-binding domain-containing protein n=1 Tax=Favolaschia claudopus TaxID=2862362 RepID=A0AAW0AAK4_9AGAR